MNENIGEPKALSGEDSFEQIKALLQQSKKDFTSNYKRFIEYTDKFEGPELKTIGDYLDPTVEGMKIAYNLYLKNYTIIFKSVQKSKNEEIDALRAALAAAEAAAQAAAEAAAQAAAEAAAEAAAAGNEIKRLTEQVTKYESGYKTSKASVRGNDAKLKREILAADDDDITFTGRGGTRRRNRQRRGWKSRR